MSVYYDNILIFLCELVFDIEKVFKIMYNLEYNTK